jgi:hypothetical protein
MSAVHLKGGSLFTPQVTGEIGEFGFHSPLANGKGPIQQLSKQHRGHTFSNTSTPDEMGAGQQG